MRKIEPARVFAIVTVVLLLQSVDIVAGDTACRTNEYELMSLLIREQYSTEFSLILIDRDTESSCLSEPLGFLKEMWPGLKGETIDSLVVSYGGAPQALAKNFTLPVQYRLMSDDEYTRILHAGSAEGGTLEASADAAAAAMETSAAIRRAAEPDWDNFDKTFPDAQGYMTFSRVAFDSACSQALVVFSNAYRCSGVRTKPQTREIACFSKKNGVWILVGVSRGVQAMD